MPYTLSGQIYLRKREDVGLWGGLWTFIENHDLNDLIKENNQSLLGIDHNQLKKHSTINHSFSHYNLEADLYLLKFTESNANKNWKNINELDNLGIPKPIAAILKKIKENGKISIL